MDSAPLFRSAPPRACGRLPEARRCRAPPSAVDRAPRPFFSDVLDTREYRSAEPRTPRPVHTRRRDAREEGLLAEAAGTPKKVGICGRHCNEHDKFEKKEDRRKSLDEARNAHKKNAEIHNKGRQVHQTFHSVTVVESQVSQPPRLRRPCPVDRETKHADETKLEMKET